jgi:hypothetical protein
MNDDDVGENKYLCILLLYTLQHQTYVGLVGG